MKQSRHTRPFTRIAAATSAAALATTGLAMPAANAGGLPENVDNYTGGGVNIRSFDTCVNKVGYRSR